ncbi:hypothetical protein K788_0009111 [Paraburkholderia caribensis MBA4]|uniref:Uncharacterized protein n=1 Tax=Paraburkholderia caribensis MBA4 TaxID=1323664 RepID=A0A0P0RFK4_9BURK|nr:hypothetical protein K788_0009111 [Paraburkholderia caribensis MBA4]
MPAATNAGVVPAGLFLPPVAVRQLKTNRIAALKSESA